MSFCLDFSVLFYNRYMDKESIEFGKIYQIVLPGELKAGYDIYVLQYRRVRLLGWAQDLKQDNNYSEYERNVLKKYFVRRVLPSPEDSEEKIFEDAVYARTQEESDSLCRDTVIVRLSELVEVE